MAERTLPDHIPGDNLTLAGNQMEGGTAAGPAGARMEGPSGGPNVTKAGHLTFDIASLANGADALAYNFGDAASDIDGAAALIAALRETICKIGWMADLASEHLGGLTVIGDAQDWLLSPASVGKPSRHDSAAARME